MKKVMFRYELRKLFLMIFIIALNSCGHDDKLKHIEGYGRIVARDSCSYIGRQAWIVNLDMTKTVLPNSSTILPLTSDTINDTVYSSLVRVFCEINEADSIIFNNDFRLNFNSISTTCPLSSHSLSNFDAEPDYGYFKK